MRQVAATGDESVVCISRHDNRPRAKAGPKIIHRGKRVGVILSGGNVDLQLFAKLVLGAA